MISHQIRFQVGGPMPYQRIKTTPCNFDGEENINEYKNIILLTCNQHCQTVLMYDQEQCEPCAFCCEATDIYQKPLPNITDVHSVFICTQAADVQRTQAIYKFIHTISLVQTYTNTRQIQQPWPCTQQNIFEHVQLTMCLAVNPSN